nr:transposase [Mycobacterium gordonae]
MEPPSNEQTRRGLDIRAEAPPVRNANGYSKDQFRIDLTDGTLTCPADHSVAIGTGRRQQTARFGWLCGSCPLRAQCTNARRGGVITSHADEAALQHARARQRDPGSQADYREYRPVVTQDQSLHPPPLGQSTLSGRKRILTDILVRAGAISLARLAVLGLRLDAVCWPSPDLRPPGQQAAWRSHWYQLAKAPPTVKDPETATSPPCRGALRQRRRRSAVG